MQALQVTGAALEAEQKQWEMRLNKEDVSLLYLELRKQLKHPDERLTRLVDQVEVAVVLCEAQKLDAIFERVK